MHKHHFTLASSYSIFYFDLFASYVYFLLAQCSYGVKSLPGKAMVDKPRKLNRFLWMRNQLTSLRLGGEFLWYFLCHFLWIDLKHKLISLHCNLSNELENFSKNRATNPTVMLKRRLVS